MLHPEAVVLVFPAMLPFGRGPLNWLRLPAVPDGGGRTGIAGTWRTEADGRVLTVILALEDGTLTGKLDGGPDYCLAIRANGNEQAANGIARGPLGELQFEAIVNEATLTIALASPSAGTPRARRILLQLTRLGDDSSFEPCVPPEEKRDPRLLGSWQNASMETVHGAMTTDKRNLHFAADGTYTRDENGKRTSGRWRTIGDLIYVAETGSAEWRVIAALRPAGAGLRVVQQDGRAFSRVTKPGASR